MKSFPDKEREFIPVITKEQMVAVDRAMVDDYHIKLVQMMELAGRNLATLTRDQFFDGDAGGKEILVLAGKGNNGGGAMVAARHLSIMGANVRVLIAEAKRDFHGAASEQLDMIRKMEVPISYIRTNRMFGNPELVIDGLIGYSLNGAPKGKTASLIGWANRWVENNGDSIIALDVPSGLDATTGEVYEPAIKAKATLTLALPKEGLLKDEAKEYVGDLYVANIGVPPVLYEKMGIRAKNLFAESDIVRVR